MSWINRLFSNKTQSADMSCVVPNWYPQVPNPLNVSDVVNSLFKVRDNEAARIADNNERANAIAFVLSDMFLENVIVKLFNNIDEYADTVYISRNIITEDILRAFENCGMVNDDDLKRRYLMPVFYNLTKKKLEESGLYSELDGTYIAFNKDYVREAFENMRIK